LGVVVVDVDLSVVVGEVDGFAAVFGAEVDAAA
jgi:hypothetical protein